MNTNETKEILIEQIGVLSKKVSDDIPFQRALAIQPWQNLPETKKCIDILSSIKEYSIFDNKIQLSGNGGEGVSYEKLIVWLLKRSNQVGPKYAVEDLDKYIEEKNVSLDLIELIIDPYSNLEYTFHNGVKYTSPSNVNNSILANKLAKVATPHPSVIAILTISFSHPTIHFTPETTDFPPPEIPYQKLTDTKLCLSLSRPVEYGVHSTASTIAKPENLPFLSSTFAWRIIPYKQPSYGPNISETEFSEADNILKKFETLDHKFKEKLRIPLSKLNNFGSMEPLVERAINLRICLESIFLDDGNKDQLRYRLGLRAALFIGNDLQERKHIFKLIKDVYDIISAAVHNGTISSNNKILDSLIAGANICKQAILKLIEKGEVDWEDLELKN